MLRQTPGALTAALLTTTGWLAAAGPAAQVLNEKTAWRQYVVFRPPAAEGRAAPAGRRGEQALSTPLPPAGWREADFDDARWQRGPGPMFCTGRAKGAALLCLRARFGVADPAAAKGLKLAIRYRGGVAVFLNGREIARGHLPAGKIEPLTFASPYPREAFVTPDGEALLPEYGTKAPPAELAGRYAARGRELNVDCPPAALRTGTNVLAIEVHRTRLPAELPRVGGRLWDTAGFEGARLTAPAGSGVGAGLPAGGAVLVWNADPLQHLRPDTPGDAFATLRPIRLIAPIHGVASGQVVVGAAAGFSGLSASAGELTGPGGAVIPASAVRVRYARLGAPFVPLLNAPVDGARVQPVWVTVAVPPSAAPGTYAGRLAVRGPVRRDVPIELTVPNFRLPDPGQWRTWVNLLQSPQSVAGHYKVPLWSDEHFRRMRPSLVLMGQAGNHVLGVSAVARSVFGDDPLIVFRKAGDAYVPDLRFLRRYLALYDECAAAPRFLSVNVWSYGMYYRGFGRDGGKGERRAETIPVQALRGEKLVGIELPMYGRPGTERLWRAVMDGVRETVRKLGWTDTRILVGTSGDTWPSAETVAFFAKVAPYAEWRVLTHGTGCPKWGASTLKRTQPNGMVVGYLEIARRVGNARETLADHPVTCNARDRVGSNPLTYRGLAAVTVRGSGYDGICWKGVDYWTYAEPDGTRRSALNTYVHFGNMVGGTPRAVAAPGPDGAVATVQYEMLREGLQDCEAIRAIERGLRTLQPPAERRYDAIELFLSGALVRESRDKSHPDRMVPRDLEVTLYRRDGTLQALSHAPTYNIADHAAEARALPAQAGERYDVRVTVHDDRWVKGGQGRYTLDLTRTGEAYAGTFTGTFRGHERKGKVVGTFRPGGLRVPAATQPPPSTLAQRCDRAIDELVGTLRTGRAVGARGSDLQPLVARVYAAAAEVAAAVRAGRSSGK